MNREKLKPTQGLFDPVEVGCRWPLSCIADQKRRISSALQRGGQEYIPHVSFMVYWRGCCAAHVEGSGSGRRSR